MAERAAAHEQKLDRLQLASLDRDRRSDRAERRRGQFLAAGIAISFAFASVACASLGYPTVASILGGSTVVGLVTVFITGRALAQPRRLTKDADSRPENSALPDSKA
ncbi:MAG: hypothetical protein JNM80_10320 [Phycisphaerae bacterium]|nr:hypothetical protein [Phycisphaerae bacterium]